jgi:threonine dehydratase
VTPFAKVSNTEALGAEVILRGNTLAEAAQHAEILEREHGFVFVHPYDDPLVIAGQGTVGLEILEVVPDVEDLLIPVGGGGLIAGIALAVKAANPRVRIVGVQIESYRAFHDAFHGVPPADVPATKPRRVSSLTLAEGIAVQRPGQRSLEITRDLVDDVVLVSEEAIEQAILSLLEVEKTVVEGAGAVGLAALNTWSMRFAGRKVVTVLTGGNIDLLVLAETTQRGLVRTGRLTRLRLSVADLPGALAEVTQLIAAHGANIVEVRHGRVFAVSGGRIQLELDIATRDKLHANRVLEALSEQGYTVETLIQ